MAPAGWNDTSLPCPAPTAGWEIGNANAYLNVAGGDDVFESAATSHPIFGPVWNAAFEYYDPRRRLDFSDTGELLNILGLGEVGIHDFAERFLRSDGLEEASCD